MSRIARITTTFDCSVDDFWVEISKPQSLEFVSAPLLRFRPIRPNHLTDTWLVGKPYELQLYLFNLIPLGSHQITLKTVDRDANTILSNESGTMAPVWNHRIQFRQISTGKLRYLDEIEIEAGWRTIFIWLFAHLFYRHRQRRWKKLLRLKKLVDNV